MEAPEVIKMQVLTFSRSRSAPQPGDRQPHSLGRGELCLLAHCEVLEKFINFSEPVSFCKGGRGGAGRVTVCKLLCRCYLL